MLSISRTRISSNFVSLLFASNSTPPTTSFHTSASSSMTRPTRLPSLFLAMDSKKRALLSITESEVHDAAPRSKRQRLHLFTRKQVVSRDGKFVFRSSDVVVGERDGNCALPPAAPEVSSGIDSTAVVRESITQRGDVAALSPVAVLADADPTSSREHFSLPARASTPVDEESDLTRGPFGARQHGNDEDADSDITLVGTQDEDILPRPRVLPSRSRRASMRAHTFRLSRPAQLEVETLALTLELQRSLSDGRGHGGRVIAGGPKRLEEGARASRLLFSADAPVMPAPAEKKRKLGGLCDMVTKLTVCGKRARSTAEESDDEELPKVSKRRRLELRSVLPGKRSKKTDREEVLRQENLTSAHAPVLPALATDSFACDFVNEYSHVIADVHPADQRERSFETETSIAHEEAEMRYVFQLRHRQAGVLPQRSSAADVILARRRRSTQDVSTTVELPESSVQQAPPPVPPRDPRRASRVGSSQIEPSCLSSEGAAEILRIMMALEDGRL